MKYIAFDIEAANGFKPYSICSVGIVTADQDFNVIHKENIWINPKTKYNLNGTRENVGINLNLDPDVLNASPDFCGVYTRLKEILEDSENVIIGHAVDSDIIMLNAACRHNNLPPINFTYTCTQLLFKLFKEEKEVRSLSKIAAEIAVDFNAHSSDEDAYVSMLTLKYLCDEARLTFVELCEKYAIRKGKTNAFKVDRCVSLIGSLKKSLTQSAVNTIKESERKMSNAVLKGYSFSFSREIELKFTAEAAKLVEFITSCGGIYASKIGRCNVYVSQVVKEGVCGKKAGCKGIPGTADYLREQYIKENTARISIEEIRTAGVNSSCTDYTAVGKVLKRIALGKNVADEFLNLTKLNPLLINGESFIADFIEEMEEGLKGDVKSLKMLPTFINPESETLEGNFLAIDAGGSTVKFGAVEVKKDAVYIKEEGVAPMPGVEREASHCEIFENIAKNLQPIINNGKDVGFCFSYPVEMNVSGDGRRIKWTKEINAPEAVGKLVGKSLLDAIKAIDGLERSAFVLNDAAAVLLSGLTGEYSAFVGLVCGTGINVCYVEDIELIKKINFAGINKMLINVEAGGFNRFDLGEIDLAMGDGQTLEKLCSGKYIGKIASLALEKARRMELISSTPQSMSTADAGEILSKPAAADGSVARAILYAIVERSAKIAALTVASTALKTLCRSSDIPLKVAVVVEGTTYFKLHGFKELFCSYLDEYLTLKNNVKYEIVEGDALKGAAIAVSKFSGIKNC